MDDAAIQVKQFLNSTHAYDITADLIGSRLGLSHDATYAALIHLEACGLARVVVDTREKQYMPKRYWEAA